MPSVELTAKGGGYFRVYVNDALFSSHLQEREAIERCTEVLYASPAATVIYRHDYMVTAELSLDAQEAPPVTDPSVLPEGDNGMDLIDFLASLDEQASGPIIVGTVLQAPSIWAGVEQLVLDHRESGSWLFQRLIARGPNGTPYRIGISWRGYALIWHLRDREAIRIGGAT